jgi:hypothetical protein
MGLAQSFRKIASVPRHREIKEGTARGICNRTEASSTKATTDKVT